MNDFNCIISVSVKRFLSVEKHRLIAHRQNDPELL